MQHMTDDELAAALRAAAEQIPLRDVGMRKLLYRAAARLTELRYALDRSEPEGES